MIRKLIGKVPSKLLHHKNTYSFFQPPKFDPSKDYYKILEISKSSSDSDIKKAYYKLAKQYHPDHGSGNQAKFKQISQAYETLSDEKNRKQYDSMRTFGNFKQNMGSKAQQGNYQYQDYQTMYDSMSPEEQEQIKQQFQRSVRRTAVIFGGIILFWIFFSRKPHVAYTEYNGTISPIEDPYAFTQAQQPHPQQVPPSQYGYQNYQHPPPPPPPQNPYNYNPQPRQPQQPNYQMYPQASYNQSQYQNN